MLFVCRVSVLDHNRLENISLSVFELNVTVGLVIGELAVNYTSVRLVESRVLNSFVFLPVSVKVVTIFVVVSASGVTGIVLEVTFIKFAIREENLHLRVLEFPVVEFSFNDLIWGAVKISKSAWLVVLPLAFVNRAVIEFTNSESRSFIVFVGPLVNIAIWVDQLSLAILETL